VIPAFDAVGAAATVTFTHEAWEHVHSELDRRYPGEKIVGWYHSHPGFGIFLSREDMFIHENFFSEWWQVAYVVDPLAGEEGIFGWRDGTVQELHRRDTRRPALGSATPAGSDRRAVGVPKALGMLALLIGAVLAVSLVASAWTDESVAPATPATAASATTEPVDPEPKPPAHRDERESSPPEREPEPEVAPPPPAPPTPTTTAEANVPSAGAKGAARPSRAKCEALLDSSSLPAVCSYIIE
jgi:hypothetical protein